MPWLQPQSVPFTLLQISAHVPSEPGVYGLLDGDACVYVGESWNLKARLLELATTVSTHATLTLVYETCREADLPARQKSLSQELVKEEVAGETGRYGLSFRLM